MRFLILLVTCSVLLTSCKKENRQTAVSINKSEGTEEIISYAKGFSITNYEDYKKVVVNSAWPNSNKIFTYLLVNKGKKRPKHDNNTKIIEIPIKTLVAVSTTNISILDYLGVGNSLIGFPNTKYICSEKARKRVDNGDIKELGNDLELNIELLLELNPEMVLGFSVNGVNKKLDQIEKLGIPVVLDGAWTEQHPLGRSEWIKFVAAFYNKEKEADSIFKTIEANYLKAKEAAKNIVRKPTVMSGSTFKDIWSVPGGKSFIAKYLEDANTDYLWKENDSNGSIQLNFENVLEKAQNAELWIGSGNFDTKKEMLYEHKGYAFFDAYKNNNVYTYTEKKGAKGGLFYYELGTLRPDLILKDFIKIAHPELLNDYELFFFKRLK
ncbi:ABC transporter substrate-binding protein [Flavivirga spongiicola]|uniref:ABC transporter substrate-binding protein n=1 Tax=Flavivirga spongiicola TaxID=421621 RepID=A0ABU7XPI6_9FLAO|nr:ABC transporter substrate-binding protein [Flavivirga sp. MEBiC05379]MDO5977680.1 ABC transporter substrate-binding protein [Flavivirga sp. MEBiC05379]